MNSPDPSASPRKVDLHRELFGDNPPPVIPAKPPVQLTLDVATKPEPTTSDRRRWRKRSLTEAEKTAHMWARLKRRARADSKR